MVQYNPDNTLFIEDKNNDYYVDKTFVIEFFNHKIGSSDKKFCVTRPRRMGKSFLVNILTAYYSVGCDSREAFSDLKIAQTPDWDKYLNKFNVININLKMVCKDVLDINNDIESFNEYNCENKRPKIKFKNYLKESVNEELIKKYPDLGIEPDDFVRKSILKIYEKTNQQFVIIIDEYDSIVRDEFDDDAISGYLNFLIDIFKNPMIDKAIAFGYLTGILPIPAGLGFSDINNVRLSSMLNGYNMRDFIGFTEDEVKELCIKHNRKPLFNELKEWYNGYLIDNMPIYNTNSVIEALINNKCDNYWEKQTEFEAIPYYINMDINGMQESIEKLYYEEFIPVHKGAFNNRINGIKKSLDSTLVYLIHAGYLTLVKIDNTSYCKIPNSEVKDEWFLAVYNSVKFESVKEHIMKSKELLEKIRNKDAEYVVNYFQNQIDYKRINRPDSHRMFQNIVLYELISCKDFYNITPEAATGDGNIDLMYDNGKNGYPTLLIELKFNESVEKAMKQIEEKRYGLNHKQEKGNILKIGMNYDSNKKEYTCIIEDY